MDDNIASIKAFYKAFNNLDHSAMASHYSQLALFTDPAFGELNALECKYMWRMLCENQKGKNFTVELLNVEAVNRAVKAQWRATYVFSKTGRRVVNVVDAHFEFSSEGKILLHHDVFNLRRWAKQALGLKGYLIGGTRVFRKKLQKQCKALLNAYIAKEN